MIYLDNAATTAMRPEVLDAMLPYMKEAYGNPGSVYSLGREARAAVDNARSQVAEFMGCKPEQVVFTSGGSEGNNLVIRGLEVELRRRDRTAVLVSKIEHDSVLKAARALCIKDGFHLYTVGPDEFGVVNAYSVVQQLRERKVGLVSVMAANNETGVENTVSWICDICHDDGALFHTDMVQEAGCAPLRVTEQGVDFATISSHKIHGPKGVGAIYGKDLSLLSPLICGGADQEFGFRGGTENVAGIVGFGKACEVSSRELAANTAAMKELWLLFLNTLKGKLKIGKDFTVNGLGACTTRKAISVLFPGVDAQSLILMLDALGICVSAGSACRSHESTPSHVLTAMGLSAEDAHSTIRVSFSELNTPEEVAFAANKIADCVRYIRGMQGT